MDETQERVTNGVMDSAGGGTAAVGGTTTDGADGTTGSVGALVGMVTGGLVIAAAAGFALGVVVGAAVTRFATPSPPPRWQVWR